MLSSQVIGQYNASRRGTDKELLCHAPFVNLNFEQNGNITACCYNRREVLGRYPADRILDAWRGPAAHALRQQIQNAELEGGCSLCRELIEAGNFAGTKARSYDQYARHKLVPGWLRRPFEPDRDLPRVVELELSNTCNLECAMCTGYFSSTIRKNRDRLPPLPMVYDQAFVQQLSQLMPALTDMKFLGGEPFLIDLYYDIWDEIVRVNPDILVHITTNATVWNNRVRSLLEKLKAGIVVSLDSLDPETYARIRSGAQLDKTLANLEKFRELTRKKGSYLSIAVCPMISNWHELPALLEFANRHRASIHFNVVWSPESLSLRAMSAEDLGHVCEYLGTRETEIPVLDLLHRKNAKAYADMLATLRFWLQEKAHKPDLRPELRNNVMAWMVAGGFSPYLETDAQRNILAGILHFEFALELPEGMLDQEETERLRASANFARWVHDSGHRPDARSFGRDYLRVLRGLMEGGFGQMDQDLLAKFELLANIMDQAGQIEQLAQDLMETPAMTQLQHIREYTPEHLRSLMQARYA